MPINDWFEGSYAIERKRIEAELVRGVDPVMLRVGDVLVLLHGGRRRTCEVITPRYRNAKAVCHAPAAVHLTLANGAGSLTSEILERIAAMRQDFETEGATLRGAEAGLLAKCVALLREVEAQRDVTIPQLVKFVAETEAPMREVIAIGTAAYLRTLGETVEAWTASWDDRTWARLLVIICAGHAPRYKESTRQYFCHLLGEEHGRGAKGEEQVLYAEGATDERDALELAATHRLNRELGRVFMASSVALQEDVLGDAARAYLRRGND